jgi:hypothetical protein
MARRPAEQRIVAEADEELRVVVVDRQTEAQTPETLLAPRHDVQSPVGKLAGERTLERAVDLERRCEDSVAERPGRVTGVAR